MGQEVNQREVMGSGQRGCNGQSSEGGSGQRGGNGQRHVGSGMIMR